MANAETKQEAEAYQQSAKRCSKFKKENNDNNLYKEELTSCEGLKEKTACELQGEITYAA